MPRRHIPLEASQKPSGRPPTLIHVLALRLSEDAAPFALILEALNAVPGVHVGVEIVTGTDEALDLLSLQGEADIVLLDVDLRDAAAAAAAEAFIRKVDYVPILIVADATQEAEAWRICAAGAQGVLPHGQLSPEAIAWRVKKTIEQFIVNETLERQLRELELTNGRFLSLVVDNADAILVVDRGGVVRFVNPSAERLLRCSASDLLGQMFGIPLEGVEATEIDLPRRGKAEPTAEIRVMRTLWDGERAFIVTMRDVSERKKSERALLVAKQTAEHANMMKSQFLANMSHELRTPLNAIIGFSELMLLDGGAAIRPNHYGEYVQDIHSAGTHLLSLINDLLDLSKAESGSTELHETSFDLVDLTSGAVELVSAEAELKGLQLTHRAAIEAAWINADERLVKQVVLNLLSNALKWTPKGGRIDVTVGRRPMGELTITVADTGTGIPKELIPRAFSAFVQLNNGYTRAEKSGTGLGLALTKRFVELHDGRITLDSEENVGTTVTIVLPAARALSLDPDGGEIVSINDPLRRDRRNNKGRHANDC